MLTFILQAINLCFKHILKITLRKIKNNLQKYFQLNNYIPPNKQMKCL